jgi:hypothetical protein
MHYFHHSVLYVLSLGFSSNAVITIYCFDNIFVEQNIYIYFYCFLRTKRNVYCTLGSSQLLDNAFGAKNYWALVFVKFDLFLSSKCYEVVKNFFAQHFLSFKNLIYSMVFVLFVFFVCDDGTLTIDTIRKYTLCHLRAKETGERLTQLMYNSIIGTGYYFLLFFPSRFL